MKIDGKNVRVFLFAHVIKSANGARHVESWQVEAFDVDHALKRLVESVPQVPRRKWEMVEELDASHEIGALGRKLPLHPFAAPGSRRIQ